MDYGKYKGRLIEYLHAKSIQNIPGLIKCFNPAHDDKEPSCQVFKDNFICYSGSCGIHGDIYDAIDILEGITDRKEQYLFAEKFFNDGSGFNSGSVPAKEEKERETFTADPEAEREIENYLKKNPAAEKMIKQFLETRAAASSSGLVINYPEKIVNELVKYFLYWPGLDLVRADISLDVLRRAGIPLTHPKKGYSTWDSSGIVMKLGTGYKLHYYKEGICEKRNSKRGYSFPMPGEIDKTKPVILVEGEMDALACRAIGIKNVFSAGGTNGITGPKVKKYLLEVPEIIFFFDADEPGRKASGLEPYTVNDKDQTNRPEIVKRAGYTGVIKIAVLPPKDETGFRDQDELIINGKEEIIIKAIAEAVEYTPPEKNGK